MTNLTTELPYYSVLLSQGFLAHILLDKIGLTLPKDKDKDNVYYINLIIILGIVCISTIFTVINEYVGVHISLITLAICTIYLWIIKNKYEPDNSIFFSLDTNTKAMFKKIIFATVILTYLFVHKDDIKKVNKQIRIFQTQELTEKNP